ncbi:MAG: hypothetical protein SOR23_01420 [Candidatus Enterosoma sp.]|nr:hypothetical protein [Candidatus Enterosoma sp.]
MTIIDSNYTCLEILDRTQAEKQIEELVTIKRLFHHSNHDTIDKIFKEKTMWFTPFEKQKTERSFRPEQEKVFFTSCFSSELFDKKTIERNRFKGDESIDKALVLNFSDIYNVFDKEKCCILVGISGKKYNIRFVGRNSEPDPAAINNFINDVFVRITPHKVVYVDNTTNITNISINNLDTNMVISNHVGQKIKDKFKYQHEIKMVAELLSVKEIEIEEPKRLEIRLNSQNSISTTII